MPIHNVSNANNNNGADKGGRTTFRPPWVKGDAQTPAAPLLRPWSQRQKAVDAGDAAKPQSKEVKVPIVSASAAAAAVPALKKTTVPLSNSSVATKQPPPVNEDVEGVKNGLKSLLRKAGEQTVAATPVAEEKRPQLGRTNFGARMASVDEPADKPGKFVRPVLKKVARPEPAPIPPKAAPLKPVVMAPIKKDESEEEDSSEEEEEEEVEEEEEEEETETETETETESESEEEVVVAKKSPPKTSTPAAKPTAAKPAAAKPAAAKPAVPAAKATAPVVKPAAKPTSNATATMPPPPPPPPPPPGFIPAPPPPPPSRAAPPADFERKPCSTKHLEYLERLKNRPRKRPDWSDMMKEVESGRKLRHVQCNDRSQPILTSKSITNIKGQFVYETEKANVHNALLKQIQFGVQLKQTRCNDRSKPVLAGLRKFRRQMTIEEQILKSESRAQLNEVPDEESEDEMDDIDKLRDDLQSSKQMLSLEMRSKEAHERENKRLLLKVQLLEADLERERSKNAMAEPGEMSTMQSAAEPPLVSSATNEALLRSLKREAEEARNTAKLLETQYQAVAEQLDAAKVLVEEQKRTIANLERRGGGGGGGQSDGNRRQSEANPKDSSPEPDADLLSDAEGDEEVDEEKKAERLARRLAREVKMMSTKLQRLKEKERAARKERENLREAMKKNQATLKVELKKFKKLQREVDKMAAMMNEHDDDEDEDAEPKDEPAAEAEEEEEDETEEESDSEESDEESESDDSESEAEDSPDEKKKENYDPRIKRHDGRLAALKKGNYLVQANVDRLQDEINKMREKSVTLKADLDSVLSELG